MPYIHIIIIIIIGTPFFICETIVSVFTIILAAMEKVRKNEPIRTLMSPLKNHAITRLDLQFKTAFRFL